MSYSSVLKSLFGHIDTRPNDYFLFGSAWSPIAIVTIYLLLVFEVLPKFMEKRNAYDLKKILIAYNILQMVLNAVDLLIGSRSLFTQKDWSCATIDFTDSFEGRRELFACYLYYLIKVLDLFDTIFFLLKKNNRQVTYLHIFHHISLVLVSWFILRHNGGGHSMWVGLFNCSVHVLMYGYYLLTVYDSSYKDVVALKKFITISQITQLVCIVISFTITLIRPCDYPKFSAYSIIVLDSYLLFLFVQYYGNTYCKSSQRNLNAQATVKIITTEKDVINGSSIGVDGRFKFGGKAH